MAEEYPLVALVIATYNHKDFIRETVAGALSQDYPNLEIVISDDCSPDGTFEILQSLANEYSGPHKLIVRTNDRNLGLVQHINKLLSEFVHGEYVMLSGGDDVCLPQTISFAVRRLLACGVDSISFASTKINAQSQCIESLEQTNRQDEVYTIDDYVEGRIKTSGACRLFKYDIFRTFGSFLSTCQTEDSTNLLRTFLYGKVGYCYSANIKYRIHGNNISGLHSLMTRFDPQEIYRQYKIDLEVARKKHLITDECYRKVDKHIARYLRINSAIRRVYKKKGYLRRLFAALLYFFHTEYSIADVRNLVGQVRDWYKK